MPDTERNRKKENNRESMLDQNEASNKITIRKDGVRVFESGASKSDDSNHLDFEGFLSPLVLEYFAEYMHKNRFQKDGTVRDSDNWQKGISPDTYMKSLLRHVMTLWYVHRHGPSISKDSIEDSLAAILFNAQGYLFERLKLLKKATGPNA